jgi:hypothetical protein
VHDFEAGESALCCLDAFEPQYGTDDALGGEMILLHHAIEIADLPDGHGSPMFHIIAPDDCGIGLAAIDCDGLGHPVAADGLG